MSVVVLDTGKRRARKRYRCQLCAAVIEPGDFYCYQANVFDDHAYTWRECQWCDRDGVIGHVLNLFDPDEGVCYEDADEWARAAMGWPSMYGRLNVPRPMRAAEHEAARNWLARASAAQGVSDGCA